MALIICKDCKNEISTSAKECPHCGRPLKKSRLGCLVFTGLALLFLFFFVLPGLMALLEEQMDRDLQDTPHLQLVSYNSYFEDGMVKIVGRVKNIGVIDLYGVEAVVEFYDKDGKYITAESRPLDFRTLRPNEISPFEVSTWNKRSIHRPEIFFRSMRGVTIQTIDGRD